MFICLSRSMAWRRIISPKDRQVVEIARCIGEHKICVMYLLFSTESLRCSQLSIPMDDRSGSCISSAFAGGGEVLLTD